MSIEYAYTDLAALPCFAYIDDYLAASEMTNKNMVDISMHPEEMWLKVWFDVALSAEDKALFDTIVTDSLGKVKVVKRREAIMAEILSSVSSQEQLGRLLNALDDYTSMAIALDNLNYDLARLRVQKVTDDGAITEADRDLVYSTIPLNAFEVA